MKIWKINNRAENWQVFSYYLLKCCKITNNLDIKKARADYFGYLELIKSGEIVKFDTEQLTFSME